MIVHTGRFLSSVTHQWMISWSIVDLMQYLQDAGRMIVMSAAKEQSGSTT